MKKNGNALNNRIDCVGVQHIAKRNERESVNSRILRRQEKIAFNSAVNMEAELLVR